MYTKCKPSHPATSRSLPPSCWSQGLRAEAPELPPEPMSSQLNEGLFVCPAKKEIMHLPLAQSSRPVMQPKGLQPPLKLEKTLPRRACVLPFLAFLACVVGEHASQISPCVTERGC